MSAEAAAEPKRGQDPSRAFSVQVILGLIVVGVLSFAAFIVLSAFADDLRKPEDGGTHALSKSAVGFAAMVALMEGEGRTVRLSRGSLDEARGAEEIGVLTPDVGKVLQEPDIASAWGAGILIVLPKWDAWPDPKHPGWVRSDGIADKDRVGRMLRRLDNGFAVEQASGAREVTLRIEGSSGIGDIPAGKIDRLQTMLSADIEPILTDADGRTVLGQLHPDYGVEAHVSETAEPPPEEENGDGFTVPDGEDIAPIPDGADWNDDGRIIYVLADPDLLNTKGLASSTTAQAGLKIFDMIAPNGQAVIFDMTLHGMKRSRNFLKLLLEPPFLPAVLCLAFAGALMALNAIAGQLRVRSGREIALGKSMLVENSALLVSMVGRDAHMGKRYAAMTRALAATAAGAPARSSEAQQTDMLDAASRASGGARFSDLAAEVAKAQTPSALTGAANRLFRWRQEIGREHRRR